MDSSIMLWVWLGVIVVASLVEVASLQMASIWFVPGGLVALILHFCGVSWQVQIIVFIVVSLALLLSLRKFCLKFLLKDNHSEKELNSLIGKEVVLLEAITEEHSGMAKIGDVAWTAVTEPFEELPKDTLVTVAQVKGNKLIVQKIVKD